MMIKNMYTTQTSRVVQLQNDVKPLHNKQSGCSYSSTSRIADTDSLSDCLYVLYFQVVH
jgi:hypothetical protein